MDWGNGTIDTFANTSDSLVLPMNWLQKMLDNQSFDDLKDFRIKIYANDLKELKILGIFRLDEDFKDDNDKSIDFRNINLNHLPNLKKYSFEGSLSSYTEYLPNSNYTCGEAAIVNFKNNPLLEELSIYWVTSAMGCLPKYIIDNNPKLKKIHFKGSVNYDIANNNNLEVIKISDNYPFDLEIPENCKNLTHLYITHGFYPKILDLSAYKKLKEVKLNYLHKNYEAPESEKLILNDLPQLENLEVTNAPDLENITISNVPRLKSLKTDAPLSENILNSIYNNLPNRILTASGDLTLTSPSVSNSNKSVAELKNWMFN